MGVWACGALRRRHGWPRSFVRRPLEWLLRIAPQAADAFLPLDNLAVGLWKIRAELRARCDLATHEGRWALLEWLAREGIEKFELEDCLSGQLGAAGAPPVARREPVISRHLCLIGYPGLVSGRAEDLRMTALALGRHGRQWAVLDRLSGEIAIEDGRRMAGFAAPPKINLVHLNADTAFFDYLFLRQCGIARGYTIGYWAWELAKFPEEWQSSFAFVEDVWAASRFAGDGKAGFSDASRSRDSGARTWPEARRFRPARRQFRLLFRLRFPFLCQPQEPARRPRRVPSRLSARRRAGLPRAQDDRLRLETRGPRRADRGDRRRSPHPGDRPGAPQTASDGAIGAVRLLRVAAPLGGVRPRPRRSDAARQAGDRDRLFRHSRLRHRRDRSPCRL